MNDKEGRGAGALVLWFVVVRSAGVVANGRGGVGAATVEGVEALAAAVSIRGGGVEGVRGVDEAGGVDGLVVVAAAVVVGGAGVEGAGNVGDFDGVVEVPAAVAVVECVGGVGGAGD